MAALALQAGQHRRVNLALMAALAQSVHVAVQARRAWQDSRADGDLPALSLQDLLDLGERSVRSAPKDQLEATDRKAPVGLTGLQVFPEKTVNADQMECLVKTAHLAKLAGQGIRVVLGRLAKLERRDRLELLGQPVDLFPERRETEAPEETLVRMEIKELWENLVRRELQVERFLQPLVELDLVEIEEQMGLPEKLE